MDYLQAWRPWRDVLLQTTPINNIVISDVAEGLYPLLHFFSQQLKNGHIPLWNPEIFLGLPTVMIGVWNFVFNPFYLVLFWLFSPATGHGLALLLDLSLIASFSYLFLRERGLGLFPSLFGSLVFTFNGHLMVWLEYMLADFAYAGTAVSLYAFEKSLSERRLRFVLINASVLGILLLCGSIQWVFFLVPLLGLYALFRTIERWNAQQAIWSNTRPLRNYLVPLAAGILIASPNLLYFLEYKELSQRTIRSFAWVITHTATFYPEFLATFVFPNFFGYQPSGSYFARGSSTLVFQNYNELATYMGVATVVLVAFAYRLNTFRWTAIFWSLIVGLALAVAMKTPGLYFLLYQYAPGFDGMQPTRTIILLPPAFAFLSALGMESLLRRPLEVRGADLTWKIIATVIVLLTIALLGTHGYLVRNPKAFGIPALSEHFRIGNPHFLYPLGILALISLGFGLYSKGKLPTHGLCALFVAVLLIDLVPQGLKMNTRVDRSTIYPQTKGLEFLTQDRNLFRILPIGFRYNTFMAFDISTLGGYASMYPASYLELLSAIEAHEAPGTILAEHNQNYVEPRTFTSSLLPMLNVKYLLGPSTADLPQAVRNRYELKHRSDIAIFEATRYLPRAYAVHQYEQTTSRSDTITRMLQGDFDPARMAVGEKPLPGLERFPDDVPPSLVSPVSVSRPNTDRFELDAQMVRPGILVVSEQFFPGWEALVDGTDAELFQVNAVLMGVALPEGPHHVTLRFMPRPFQVGLIFTAFIGGLIVVLLVLDALHATRHTPPPDRDTG